MTPTSISILSLTVTATSDITGGLAVGFDGAQATVLGQKVLGIARNDATTGQALTVYAKGVAVVQAAEAIAVGDEVTVDANGKFVVRTVDTQFLFGHALTAASADGDKFEALQS